MDKESQELLDRINALDAGQAEEEPQGIAVRVAPCIKLTVGQLRKAVEANPEHPVAKAVSKVLARHTDKREIAMERADVRALLENRNVQQEVRVEDFHGEKRRVVSKVLGDPLNAPKPKEILTTSKSAKKSQESKPAEN